MTTSPQFVRLLELLQAHRARPGVPVAELRADVTAAQAKRPLAESVTVEAVDAGGVPGEFVASADCPAAGRVLMYLHGGGYVLGSLDTARPFAATLADAARCRVLAVDYRLAPEFPYPAAIDDTAAAYQWLLDQGHNPAQIVLCGDSAGGGLAVATLLAAKKTGLPLPAGCVCFSPWTDLSLSGPSYVTNADCDPQVSRAMLAEMAAHYVGHGDVATDLISPVHGDLAGLPPLLIQVGSAEALLDDSRALRDAAAAAGVDVTLDIWPAMTHVWQLYAPKLPEARDAVDQAAAWLDRVWRGEGEEVR